MNGDHEPGREPLRVALNRLRCPPRNLKGSFPATGRELAEALHDHDRHLDLLQEPRAFSQEQS